MSSTEHTEAASPSTLYVEECHSRCLRGLTQLDKGQDLLRDVQ